MARTGAKNQQRACKYAIKGAFEGVANAFLKADQATDIGRLDARRAQFA
jgi:hypothetical protein